VGRDKEKKREYDRRWYEANRDHKLETKKSWYRTSHICKIFPRVCAECAKGFIGRQPSAKFCSRKCAARARYKVRRNDPNFLAFQARYQKKWSAAHPERVDYKSRKCRYKKYGTTIEQVDAWVVEQNNLCLICGKPFTDDDPYVVDHCHTKIIARGLLHERCNLLIGMADDNPALLRGAAEYLERTNGG
jgi:recombination endonuclease VII